VNGSAYEIQASSRRCRESEGSVKYGDSGNPGLVCSANNRRSQFPRDSVAVHDIKTDLDRRKKFLLAVAVPPAPGPESTLACRWRQVSPGTAG
jgi:hypothetical protein